MRGVITSINCQVDFFRYHRWLILGGSEDISSASTVVGVKVVTFHGLVVKEILLQRMSRAVLLDPLHEATGTVETDFQFLRGFIKTENTNIL